MGPQVKGFTAHLLWSVLLSQTTQATSSPHQQKVCLGCPRSSAGPCSLMRAGFFNKTWFLSDFPHSAELMGPSISPVPVLVCLSPPGSTLFPPRLCKGAVAGLASSIRVYSSHLAASGLRAKSSTPSACPRCGTRLALPGYPCATWQPTRVAGARVCMRGDGTMSSSMPACMLEAGAPLQGQPPLEDLPRVMWSTC